LAVSKNFDQISLLVDGSSAADIDLGLVDPGRGALRAPEKAQPFIDAKAGDLEPSN
jgi:hypothetical protein